MAYIDECGEIWGEPGEDLRKYFNEPINKLPYLPGGQHYQKSEKTFTKLNKLEKFFRLLLGIPKR